MTVIEAKFEPLKAAFALLERFDNVIPDAERELVAKYIRLKLRSLITLLHHHHNTAKSERQTERDIVVCIYV
jgi:hypothetical protein